MDRSPPPSRRRLTLAMACCLVAIALGLWLRVETARHTVTGTASSCTFAGTGLDCDRVQASEWADLGGISLSLWAAVGHGALFTWLLGARRGRPAPLALAAVAALLAALFSLYLLGISLFVIGATCLYCNGIQLATVVVAVLIAPGGLRALRAGALRAPGPLARAAVAGAVLLALGALAETWADTRVALGRLYAMPRGADLEVDPSDAIVLGDPDTPHSLLVYFDFTCPYCRGAHTLIEEQLERFPRRFHAIFKHYPLNTDCNPGAQGTIPGHEKACLAAEAACAAQVMGQGAPFARALFEVTGTIYEPQLLRIARRVGLDEGAFRDARGGPRARALLQRDVTEGMALGVTALPKAFLNGNAIDWGRLPQILESLAASPPR